jgi:hypothetical protein
MKLQAVQTGLKQEPSGKNDLFPDTREQAVGILLYLA